MPLTWQQVLCRQLCELYKKVYGGDCDDLDCDPGEDDAANTVVTLYEDDGLPAGMTDTEKCDLLGYLNSLETHLALPGNTLTPATNSALDGMIAGMRLDIGVVAGCSN